MEKLLYEALSNQDDNMDSDNLSNNSKEKI